MAYKMKIMARLTARHGGMTFAGRHDELRGAK
jgi:hypothetical protein